MGYDKVEVPSEGRKVEVTGDDELVVPDDPIIPIIHGDGIGVDVGPAAQTVLEAAADVDADAVPVNNGDDRVVGDDEFVVTRNLDFSALRGYLDFVVSHGD